MRVKLANDPVFAPHPEFTSELIETVDDSRRCIRVGDVLDTLVVLPDVSDAWSRVGEAESALNTITDAEHFLGNGVIGELSPELPFSRVAQRALQWSFQASMFHVERSYRLG